MTVQFGLPIVGHPNANVIETMDSGQIDPCHEYPSPGYTEHSLSSDWSTYASSPNSLFMYEQERSDMLNSYDTCGLTTSIKMEDMNELSPGMEDTSLDTWCPGSVDMSDCSDGGSKILESWAVKDMGLLNMDDVFQRDSTDLVHGPTLAELNSQDSLNFLDIGDSKNRIACSDIKIPLSVCRSGSVFDEDDMKPLAIKIPTQTMEATKTYRAGANVSILPNRGNGQLNALPATTLENFTLQQLLASNGGQPSLTNIKPAAKSSRATSTSVIETKQVPLDKDTLKKWEEIKEFIHSDSGEITTEVAPRRIKSESGIDNVMVKEEEDEDFMDDDSERSDDDDDDDDDNVSEIGSHASSNCSHTMEQVEMSDIDKPFWHYNAQSKGPKGAKLCLYIDQPDPHILNKFHDPVFDPGQRSLAGILHGGKQRRGDGNDVLPNPRKMYNIGLELKKLNKLINDMTPVSELPVSARPRSRREKNKLASRACRLKKKAQHEANKVKLFGLDREHERLNAVLHSIKDEIQDCAQSTKQEGEEKMSTKLQNLIKKHLSHMIAGHTTEYVNSVLDKVATGDPHGGLKNY